MTLTVTIIGLPALAICWDRVQVFAEKACVAVHIKQKREEKDWIDVSSEPQFVRQEDYSSQQNLSQQTQTPSFDAFQQGVVSGDPVTPALNQSMDAFLSNGSAGNGSPISIPVAETVAGNSISSCETASLSLEQEMDSPVTGIASSELIDTRFLELGVDNIKMEPWGNNGKYWRFSCEITRFGITYCFESVHSDRNTAKVLTLEKIEKINL